MKMEGFTKGGTSWDTGAHISIAETSMEADNSKNASLIVHEFQQQKFDLQPSRDFQEGDALLSSIRLSTLTSFTTVIHPSLCHLYL